MTATEFGYLTPETLWLFTDRCELTMMQGYHAQDHTPTATFDLFFRDLPPKRGYMLAAGLEQAIHVVETLAFGDRGLRYLEDEGFDPDFLTSLEDLSFTGDEQSLVDFGSRRAHGTDAGMKAARAAYVGGFDGTSNMAAGEALGVPTFGTMAHSWVQSFETERDAFEAFVAEFGDDSILLVDTYDTVAGAEMAQAVAEEMGVDLAGVRLDSGDLTALSKAVDDRLGDVDIFISSGVDEYAIREFLSEGGVAAGFGPGTALVTSTDAPKVEGVYKLVAVERGGEMEPSMKLSTGKVTYPGAKSVCRVEDDGVYEYDTLALRAEADEVPGTDLLETFVEDGEVVYDVPSLDEIRERARVKVSKLPPEVRELDSPEDYEVRVGNALASETDSLRGRLERMVEGGT